MARKTDDARRGAYLRKPKAAPQATTNFVRQWREFMNNMTQEELAAAADLSTASISAYERGETDPSGAALGALSAALGVPRGMILDVNPFSDPPLWSAFLRATKGQKEEIGRVVGALVGAVKPKGAVR